MGAAPRLPGLMAPAPAGWGQIQEPQILLGTLRPSWLQWQVSRKNLVYDKAGHTKITFVA